MNLEPDTPAAVEEGLKRVRRDMLTMPGDIELRYTPNLRHRDGEPYRGLLVYEAGLEIGFMSLPPTFDADGVALLAADRVQDEYLANRTGPWPACPDHPHHPLHPAMRDGEAVWTCLTSRRIVAVIGALHFS